MNRKQRLKSNIGKNYLFTLMYNLDLTRGIWMIYLASKGMSLTQLGLLETIFHLTSFTMEVPTGAVADLFGRKTSRVGGRILALVSVVMLLLSNQFWGFAIAFIFSALSYNLESGAGDALIYDSLKELDRETEFMRINGTKEVFYQTASVISFFIGGYLATKSYPMAFYITIVIGILTILQSTCFIEPKIEKTKVDERESKREALSIWQKGFCSFKDQLADSVKVVRQNPKIASLMMLGQLIGTFCTCIFYYNQNYLISLHYSEAIIGLILATSSVAAAIISAQVHRIESVIKERGILLGVPWITVACIWGIALTPYHYIFFIIMMMTESVTYIAMTDYINKLIPSENRATILSFASMVFSFFMIILFPLVGVIGDLFDLRFAFIVMGTLGILFVLINSILILKSKRKEPVQND
ncbi:MFS transporter [Fusibacter sp. 3D3]|uniref:MFS transporter n=1 Tax=Fusibacter sp. 3D3 TaxID=1048380 RepID=UPI0008539D44|nr:MFS transporter [Fusibacter sp. 3D3]GAU79374.1 transport protein [Fusibacter sp. 3D3]